MLGRKLPKRIGADRGGVSHAAAGRPIPLSLAGPVLAPILPAPPGQRIANARAQQQKQLGQRIANARGAQQIQLDRRIANARAGQQAQLERRIRAARLGRPFEMRERRAERVASKRLSDWGLAINPPRVNTDPRTGRRLFERGLSILPQYHRTSSSVRG